MINNKIEDIIEENMMKVGFILGLGVDGITNTDKLIIKKAMSYRLKNTKRDLAIYLDGLDDIKICEQIINTTSYWIERDFINSRVPELKNESERLSDNFYSKLMIRYKARLVREFRGIAETSRMYRDTISKINKYCLNNESFDEGGICIQIKNAIVIAKSCHYKLKSGLLFLELMGICNNIQSALARICYFSYIHESNNFLLKMAEIGKSEFLDDWVERHHAITNKHAINHDELYNSPNALEISKYIDEVINSVDSLAKLDAFWADVKINVEISRTTLGVISSYKERLSCLHKTQRM